MKKLIRFYAAFCCFILLFVLAAQPAAAQQNIYKILQYPFYDSEGSGSCTLDFTDTDTINDGSIWSSGLSPPYILEQFAIETLKAIAKKKAVDQNSAVTQEHVIALVAFMYGEGGDIANPQLFNPLNSGLNAPELIVGAHAPNGVQSFKSFDAGVEATARTMAGSNQSRLAATLVQSNSSAQQFMYALTYYNKFPGNFFWAEASKPPKQDSYYRTRIQLVQQVRSDYSQLAGTVIGTTALEAIDNVTDSSKLQYRVAGSSDVQTTGLSTSGCEGVGSGVVAGNIVQTALNLSWPESHGLTPKRQYTTALKKYNPEGQDNFGGADCGTFVATVMRASNADLNYPSAGTAQQTSYVRSHPEKYEVLDNVSSTSELQPGDIMIVNSGSGEGVAGHTYIFVGNQPNGTDEASASYKKRMPSLGKAVTSDQRGNYLRARLIK